MTIRIPSARLVGMLTDLARTAHRDPEVGGATAGVLLHSDRGHHGGEPGQVTVLAGLSMNRRVVGHTAEPASAGQLAPTLVPIAAVRMLIGALKELCRGEKDHGPKHSVAISLSGDVVEVVEDLDQKQLFGEPTSWRTSFPAGRIDDYPRGPWHLLASVNFAREVIDMQGDRIVSALPRTDFNAADLAPFAAIAARRGSAVELYRHHQRHPVGIQIGSAYRGAIIPESYPDLNPREGTEPDAPIYIPHLPPRKDRPDAPPPVDLDRPEWSTDEPAADPAPTEPMITDDGGLVADVLGMVADAADALVLADNGDAVPVELLADAAAIVVGEQIGSRSTVQRRLRVGKTMSGRIMDHLQAIGVLSASDGANPREVLARPDQLDDVLATIRGEVR